VFRFARGNRAGSDRNLLPLGVSGFRLDANVLDRTRLDLLARGSTDRVFFPKSFRRLLLNPRVSSLARNPLKS